MRRVLFLLIAAAGAVMATPTTVVLQGIFVPSYGPPTVFDHQSYSVQFTIPDVSLPDSSIVSPDLSFRSITYLTPGTLSVPGLGLSVVSPLQVQYVQSAGDQWLNLFQFSPLPVGDFMLLTPFYPVSKAPLWNGLADGIGTPALNSFSGEPFYSLWRLQQVPTPGLPSIPLAGFESRTDTYTISESTAIPEPGTFVIVLAGLPIAFNFIRRRAVGQFPATRRPAPLD